MDNSNANANAATVLTKGKTICEIHTLSGGKQYVLAFNDATVSIYSDHRVEYTIDENIVMYSTAAAEAIARHINVVLFNPQ